MNLFDITIGQAYPSCDKPRRATETERNAYLQWLALRRGVDIGGCELSDSGAWRGEGKNAVCVLTMPGYGQQPAAIMETLDEAGEVIRTTTLATDTKGYMVLKAKQVQDACGLKAVRKSRKAKVTPVVTTPDPVDVSAPPVVILGESSDLVAQVPSAPIEAVADPIAAIVARVEELEARLAALSEHSQASMLISGASSEGEEIKAAPVAKRTPAHERAIRRAWAERRERMERADLDRRALLKVNADNRLMLERLQAIEAERDTLAEAARDALANLGKEAQRAKVAEAALARIKREQADPTTPDRASDVAMLLRERDAARTANAALQARAERSERAVHDLADRFETMASRVSIAEAAVRRAAA